MTDGDYILFWLCKLGIDDPSSRPKYLSLLDTARLMPVGLHVQTCDFSVIVAVCCCFRSSFPESFSLLLANVHLSETLQKRS